MMSKTRLHMYILYFGKIEKFQQFQHPNISYSPTKGKTKHIWEKERINLMKNS